MVHSLICHMLALRYKGPFSLYFVLPTISQSLIAGPVFRAGSQRLCFAIIVAGCLIHDCSYALSNDLAFIVLFFIVPVILWFSALPVFFYVTKHAIWFFSGKQWIRSVWWWLQYSSAFIAAVATFYVSLLLFGYSIASLKVSLVLFVLWSVAFAIAELKNLFLRRAANSGEGSGHRPWSEAQVDRSPFRIPKDEDWSI